MQQYLATLASPQIDWIVFGSAQITSTTNNILSLPHGAIMEAAEAWPERTIRHMRMECPDDDDEEARARICVELLAEAPPKEPQTKLIIGDAEADPQAPALRLDAASIQHVQFRGIRYDSHAYPVAFQDWVETGS